MCKVNSVIYIIVNRHDVITTVTSLHFIGFGMPAPVVSSQVKDNGFSVRRRTRNAVPKRRYNFTGLQERKIPKDKPLHPPSVPQLQPQHCSPTISPRRKLFKPTLPVAVTPCH